MLPRPLPAAVLAVIIALAGPAAAADPWLALDGADGPGKGLHVVLVSGDEEYRSEEALPQLARILARHHGFRCTVLFAIDPKDGTIAPRVRDNIPGLEALASADLMVIATRFRKLPPGQMKWVADYVAAGRPVVGLRTATHAFRFPAGHPFARYSFDSREPGWEGGFGRRVLGETWVDHHGDHGTQATRGVVAPGREDDPILRGIKTGDVFGPTDVYAVRLPLPGDSRPLLLGQVVAGVKPTDPPAEGVKNAPMMPVAWTRTYPGEGGKTGRAFCTTMGASQDFESEGFRRLVVNACLWAVGREDRIPPAGRADLVGAYRPRPFGGRGEAKGVRPADLAGPGPAPPGRSVGRG